MHFFIFNLVSVCRWRCSLRQNEPNATGTFPLCLASKGWGQFSRFILYISAAEAIDKVRPCFHLQALKEEEMRRELRAQGKEVPPPEISEVSDRNVITPGTEFMEKLSQALQYYIRARLNTDPGWKDIMVCSCASVNAVHVPCLRFSEVWTLVISSTIWSSGRRLTIHLLWRSYSLMQMFPEKESTRSCLSSVHNAAWKAMTPTLDTACMGMWGISIPFSLNNLFLIQMLCSTDPVRTLSTYTGVKNCHCRMQIW